MPSPLIPIYWFGNFFKAAEFRINRDTNNGPFLFPGCPAIAVIQSNDAGFALLRQIEQIFPAGKQDQSGNIPPSIPLFSISPASASATTRAAFRLPI
jgi:hypothetical protein